MKPQERILVVDDQYSVKLLIQRVLTEAGYAVDTAANGIEAIAKLDTEPQFALIITDLSMPDVSGLDVLTAAKKRLPSVEVILITAHSSLESAVAALREGAHDYITKPFEIEELLHSVQQTLAYRHLKLEKANLITAHKRQVTIRNTLIEAGQRIATELDQQSVLRTILQATLKVMPQVEQVVVYYRPNGEDKLAYIGLTSSGDAITTSPVEQSLIEKSLQERTPIYKSNWTPLPETTPKSLLIEPLILPGISMGALAIIGATPEAFPPDYRQVLTMLTNQAAIALQNARLYAEARRVDELGALVEAGQAINRTLNLRETLQTTLTVTRNLTGALISNIYLYTPTRNRIDSVITLGNNASLTDVDRREASQLAWDVLNSNYPKQLRSPNASLPAEQAHTIQSWLAVPLATGTSPVGVLVLGSERINAFTPDDPRMMQVIAAQASTAIENARLYEELQRRLQQTEALDTITRGISTTLDLPSVLHLVVQSAVKTIPAATNSTLYLLTKTNETLHPEAQASAYRGDLPAGLEPIRQQIVQQTVKELSTVRRTWQSEVPPHTQWSFLTAPLQVGDSIMGAIAVESPHPNGFLPGDETLLNTFASHASVAIQNANLFRDLTSAYIDLKHHQGEIVRGHRTLQALFDGITDGLHIVDKQLNIIAINQAEAERTKHTPQEIIGQHCDSSIWGGATEAVAQIVYDTIETGKSITWESTAHTYKQIKATDRGPFIDRDVRTYPIFAESGEVNQVIIFAQDVSEKRRLQATLFRSANLAAVGQLASSIAHEINNPLTVIIANSQVMQMEIDPADPNALMVDYMLDAGMRIQHIVQNLLDFSTQESYEWAEVSLETTIEDALTLIAAPLRKSKIQVIKKIEPLPTITASANHLQLIWMNLLQNARDAIIQSDRKGVIEIKATRPSSDTVQVQICDNGVGVPPQSQNRLFHPFFTTKPPGQGPGLGLYTCRTIVEHHQGQIEVFNNQEGHGATATVTLPIDATPPPGGVQAV